MTNRNKNILLGLLIVGVVGMTVAFAALSTTLNISGTANVPAASWDIHFENWTMDKPTNNLAGVANTASQTTGATMSPSNKGTSISGLVVSLAQPGDTISYTFDIVNDGSINALLDAFSTTISAKVAPANTENASTSDLTYTVVCGEQATKGSQLLTDAAAPVEDTDMLDAGKARACKLTISYNVVNSSGTAGQTQTYTGQARTVTLGANWVWVQGNTSAQSGGNGGQGGGSGSGIVYYTPTQSSGGATLPANSNLWVQNNTSTGVTELCSRDTATTLCYTAPTTEQFVVTCDGNNENCVGNSYAQEVKSAFEQAGFTCNFWGTSMACNGQNMICQMGVQGDGFINCDVGDGYCQIPGQNNEDITCFTIGSGN